MGIRYLCVDQFPFHIRTGSVEADFVIGTAGAFDDQLTITALGDLQRVFIDSIHTRVEDRSSSRRDDGVVGNVIVFGAELEVDAVLHERGGGIGKMVADYLHIGAAGLDAEEHPHPAAVTADISLD